jgi:hypothetical protein
VRLTKPIQKIQKTPRAAAFYKSDEETFSHIVGEAFCILCIAVHAP